MPELAIYSLRWKPKKIGMSELSFDRETKAINVPIGNGSGTADVPK